MELRKNIKTYKVINSMVEYFAYNEEVNGSSPLLPIINQGAR